MKFVNVSPTLTLRDYRTPADCRQTSRERLHPRGGTNTTAPTMRYFHSCICTVYGRTSHSKPAPRESFMRSIPIDVLRAFVAVVEARGFTRAAAELGRSQPTISLQVKRLEELVEAPLFEKTARFGLTEVGAICFDYGKRLLRLHDDMLDEVSRRRRPGAMFRVGVASEFAARLVPRLGQLRLDAAIESGFEVVLDAGGSFVRAFRQNALDVAFVIGDDGEAPCAGRWRASLRWFGDGARGAKHPLPLAIAPQGCAIHEAA